MNLSLEQRPTARRVLIGIWVAMMVFVVWSSLIPDDSPLMKTVEKLDLSDKVLHFCAYLVLSLLAAVVQRTRRNSVIAALLMGVLGIALEIFQGFTATRTMDVADAVANWSGVACGMLLGLVLV